MWRFEGSSSARPTTTFARRLGLIATTLLLSPAGSPAQPRPGAAEITVAHAPLAKLRLELGADDAGVYGCRVTVSSGDPLVDSFACPAARICVPVRPQTHAQLVACIDGRIIALVVKHDGYAVQR